MGKFLTAFFYLLTILEYASFYYTLFGKRIQLSRERSIGLICTVPVLSFGVWHEWGAELSIAFPLFVSVFVMFFLFEIEFWENIRIWLLALTVLTIIESIFYYMVYVFSPIRRVGQNILYAAGVIVCLWIFYLVIGRKFDKDAFYLPVRIWAMVEGIMLILMAVLTFFVSLLMDISGGTKVKVGLVLISAGGFIICLLLFGMIYYLNVTQKFAMQAELLEAQNEQQREYFMQLLQKEQETRQFRHDVTSDLLALSGYCERGEQDELKRYLEEMLGSVSKLSRRQYDVGNDIVNTIINYYFQPLASDCEISVKGYMGEELSVTQRDLCVIVSNLVKNAVEAVEQVHDLPKQVRIEVNQGKQFLKIRIENTIEQYPTFSSGGLPQTTKADKRNHGLGLRNVKSVVDRYQGSYRNFVENQSYIVEVMLKV